MDELDKQFLMEKFTQSLSADFDDIKLLYKFLNIDDNEKKKELDKGMKIIQKKIKRLRKAKDMNEFSELLKVKKILKMNDDDGRKK